MSLENLKPEIKKIISSQKSTQLKLQSICDTLHEIKNYDWVGFYFKNGSKNELKLGPFSGEATDHEIIPFGKGI